MEKRIAVYNGPGVNFESTIKKRWFLLSDDFEVSTLNHDDFTRFNLDKFDIVVLPGGKSSQIRKALELAQCRKPLVDWVFDGGTIIGVCAGMYAMSKGYNFSLDLINYEVVDRPNWRRGKHYIRLNLTDYCKEFLNIKRNFFDKVNYNNGPVVQRLDSDDVNITDEKILAYFDCEFIAEGSKLELMKNTPAIIKNKYGKGTVIALSPHLEANAKYRKIMNKLIKKL